MFKDTVDLRAEMDIGERLREALAKKNAALSDAEIENKVRSLEGELMPKVIDAPPQPDLRPTRVIAPLALTSGPQCPDAQQESQAVPLPGITRPAMSGSCDKHGPFVPKSKWEPSCPDCRDEWEQASEADRKRMSNLLPGEPLWRLR
jgi:hypothetical protein